MVSLEERYKDDVEWHIGEKNQRTLWVRGEFLEQFDVNLENADASASQVYASASRTFQEARELLSRVKSVRGFFSFVGIGALHGLAQ